MPKYTARLTVPPERDSQNPVTADLKVGQGRISQVSVTWTPGSQWLNALVVKYEGGQIIPSEGGGQCRGDGEPETWPEHIILDTPHPVLNVEAWNEGNDHEHEVLFSVVMLPVEADPVRPIQDMVNLLKRLFRI